MCRTAVAQVHNGCRRAGAATVTLKPTPSVHTASGWGTRGWQRPKAEAETGDGTECNVHGIVG